MGLFIQCDGCLKMIRCGKEPPHYPGWQEQVSEDDGRVYGHICPECAKPSDPEDRE